MHTRLTFFLGPLYLIGPLAMVRAIGKDARPLPYLFIASAIAWAVLATWFKLAPNGYDGIVEKAAVLVTLLWLVPLSVIFLGMGRRGLRAESTAGDAPHADPDPARRGKPRSVS